MTWLSQFPVHLQPTIRALCVPTRNPVPRKERRAAERAARKAPPNARPVKREEGPASQKTLLANIDLEGLNPCDS